MMMIVVHSPTSRLVVAECVDFIRIFISPARRVDLVEKVQVINVDFTRRYADDWTWSNS